MIPLFKTKIQEESIKNVETVLRSGWLGLGPMTEKFEKEFAAYIGCKHAIAVNSGTAALYLATELAGLLPSSRVISTPLTFVATNHVLLQNKLDPVFADIDMLNGNMDLKSIRELCRLGGKPSPHNTTRPKAIMAVHYGGHPFNLDFLYEIAQEYKLQIIEDAAHACGASYNGEKIGARAKFCCFSFHAVKNLPMGDGGMLVTNDDEIAEKARKRRWFGITKNTSERSSGGLYSWKYDVECLGYKSHGNDLTSAIGLGELKHLDEGNQFRHWVFKQYQRAGLPMLTEFSNVESSHHLAVMLAWDKEAKEKIMENFGKHGIQYGVHYTPNYYYPIYKDCLRYIGCPNVEEFYSRCISLPNHLYLTEEDVQNVIDAVQEARI